MENDMGLIERMMIAAGMHEHFTTLLEAGFTEDEAVQLLVRALAGQNE